MLLLQQAHVAFMSGNTRQISTPLPQVVPLITATILGAAANANANAVARERESGRRKRRRRGIFPSHGQKLPLSVSHER